MTRGVTRSGALVQTAEGAVSVDIARLDSPAQIYDADAAWVEHENGGPVELLFAKIDRDNRTELKTRLVIKYSPDAFLRHFWENSREFHERLKSATEGWPVAKKAYDARTMRANREHSEWANFDTIAQTGMEACIDFFSMSVTRLALFARKKVLDDLELAPRVRVQLMTQDLKQLLDECGPIAERIKEYVPQTLLSQS